jgi:alkaline phosphatase D
VDWVRQQLRPEFLNWLISGDQFFGAYHKFESFAGEHPQAFRRFLQTLRQSGAPLLFVSGDRHLSEIMKISRPLTEHTTYEITSSPIHSSVHPGAALQHENPRRIQVVDGQWNYVLIDAEQEKAIYRLDVSAKGHGSRVFFTESLQVAR